jgi:hypothetical protein
MNNPLPNQGTFPPDPVYHPTITSNKSVAPVASAFGVWVPVAERLPKAGRRVFVTALNGVHLWPTVGEYWPAGTMDASNWDDPPDEWWDEDGDKCTNPEPGWYESPLEPEMKYELTSVTHWMPLPPLPDTRNQPRDE